MKWAILDLAYLMTKNRDALKAFRVSTTRCVLDSLASWMHLHSSPSVAFHSGCLALTRPVLHSVTASLAFLLPMGWAAASWLADNDAHEVGDLQLRTPVHSSSRMPVVGLVHKLAQLHLPLLAQG